MNRQTEQQLIDEYLSNLSKTQFAKTKKFFVIGFIGLPGSGKTTVANKLSQKLGIFVAVNDNIRRFLNMRGYPGHTPAPSLVEKITRAKNDFLFKEKISFIFDSDLIKFSDSAKQLARDHQAQLFFVKIYCPEEVALERIHGRLKIIESCPEANPSLADPEVYFSRKKIHELYTMPEFNFAIQTHHNLDIQIDNFINFLNNEGVL